LRNKLQIRAISFLRCAIYELRKSPQSSTPLFFAAAIVVVLVVSGVAAIGDTFGFEPVSEREEDGEAMGGFGEEPVSDSAANGSFDAVDGDFLCTCAAVLREDEVMRSKLALLLDLVDACLVEEAAVVAAGAPITDDTKTHHS
jgi:hypothetical protein